MHEKNSAEINFSWLIEQARVVETYLDQGDPIRPEHCWYPVENLALIERVAGKIRESLNKNTNTSTEGEQHAA